MSQPNEADKPRPERWRAQVDWRDGRLPLWSPALPWKQLKSWMDGALAGRGAHVERMIIEHAGETRPGASIEEAEEGS